MFPTVVQILRESNAYVPLPQVCDEIRRNYGQLAINSPDVTGEVMQCLARAHKYGLAFKNKDGAFKFAVDLDVQENENFKTRVEELVDELASGATGSTSEVNSAGPSDAGQDCGPGWRRRPVAQRQAIAIYRRMKAERQAGGRGRSPARRGRSRSRSRSRRRRSRSRSRSRSRR